MPENLQPAVPAFTYDSEAAFTELGKTFVYVKQLSDAMVKRAEEINRVDDERLEAVRKAEMLGYEVDRLRARVQELEAAALRQSAIDPSCGCACEHCED